MAQATINLPVFVNVRVEAPTKMVFEGTVMTRGREVTAETGGTHLCDGTNGNENPLPGPTTCTSALDDASRPSLSPRPFTWDGVYSHQHDDFQITRIGEFTATDTGENRTFWTLRLNYQPVQVGGGRLQIKSGDSVLWAIIPVVGHSQIPLRLKGPLSARNNVQFIVNVSNGINGLGVNGATVTAVARVNNAGVNSTTDEYGSAWLTLAAGTYDLKARRNNTITSNVLQIVVVN